MNEVDLFEVNGEPVGVRISLKEKDSFNIIRETLTRIGIDGKDINKATGEKLSDTPVLWQSCHIFHKQGQYAIMHFKEMLAFDGKDVDISDQDIKRRNTIANLLEQWGLCTIIDTDISKKVHLDFIKIVSSSDKDKWKLRSKYTIGKKKSY
jgi:hypothetical protein